MDVPAGKNSCDLILEIRVDTTLTSGVRYGDRTIQRDLHYTIEVVSNVIYSNPSKVS